MDKFICKDGASLYYLRDDKGAGGFLNPPEHPEHRYSIVEKRGGHECGFYSLSSAAKESYLPAQVRSAAKGVLKRWKAGKPDESWLGSVYNYFRNCYSLDGVNRSASDCIVDRTNSLPAFHHLAYLFVREFYPDHLPDVGRILHNDPRGKWSKE